MIEFAIVIPVLLTLVLGMVDLATAMYDLAVITNASRSGARWGTIPSNNPNGTAWSCTDTGTTASTPCAVANSFASAYLISYAGTPTLSTTTSGGGTANSVVTVTVTYNYQGMGILKLFTSSNPLSATTKMSYE